MGDPSPCAGQGQARIAAGATEVAVQLYRYHFEGRIGGGGVNYLTAESAATSGSAQEQQPLEEARLHGCKEVIKVTDTELDGRGTITLVSAFRCGGIPVRLGA
jgi:hypothetical protein